MDLKLFYDKAFDYGYYLFSDNQCHYFGDAGIMQACRISSTRGRNLTECMVWHGMTMASGAMTLPLDRWDRIDKLCEQYFHISPYVYCGGNSTNA